MVLVDHLHLRLPHARSVLMDLKAKIAALIVAKRVIAPVYKQNALDLMHVFEQGGQKDGNLLLKSLENHFMHRAAVEMADVLLDLLHED